MDQVKPLTSQESLLCWECPPRAFGKADVKVSAFGLGGHHLGAAKDEQTAVNLIHKALDGGINFYDCCWEYNRGKSER
jgi:aryl-alcohol dehydrogenase-like predicted oxidoreductase